MSKLVNRIFRFSSKYCPYSRNERKKKEKSVPRPTTPDYNSLIEVIICQLKHNIAAERAFGSDMTILHVNDGTLDHINLNVRKSLVKQLSILLFDPAEKVCLGAIDALRYVCLDLIISLSHYFFSHLSALNYSILPAFLEDSKIIESIISFLHKFLTDINFNTYKWRRTKIQSEIVINCFDILINILLVYNWLKIILN